MRKLLCFFGWHKWTYDGEYKRTCQRCPEWQFNFGGWYHDKLGTEHRRQIK